MSSSTRSARTFSPTFHIALVPSKDHDRGPLCFAEFTNPELAFLALETLEGYLIDRDDPDSTALHIAFAKNKPSGSLARGGGRGR